MWNVKGVQWKLLARDLKLFLNNPTWRTSRPKEPQRNNTSIPIPHTLLWWRCNVKPCNRLFVLARITLAKKDKGQCLEMCDYSEIVENAKVCNGTAPSQCRTLLSCQDNCSCWINLQCNGGSGGQPSNGKVGVGWNSSFCPGFSVGRDDHRQDHSPHQPESQH